MSVPTGMYPMKAVVRLTGLSADTIRAWERRYMAIAPQRTEGDHRLYSDADVERLRLLRQATEAGHGIGRAARLADAELRSLLGPVASPPPGMTNPDVVARILAATDAYDHQAAERELTRAATLLPPRRVVLEVAQPLLTEVGQRWAEGSLSVGQEHLISGLVRSLLGSLLRLIEPSPSRPGLVLATLPGERHELGVLMVALLAGVRGVPVCCLGPDVPIGEVAAAVRRTGAAAAGLSLVRVDDPAVAAADVCAIAAGLPPKTPLWLGGAGVARLPLDALPPAARVLWSAEELEGAIEALSR